jgi:D-alanyl-lipoteichoic acid acyltransferase DltB (MBOAT superfamily)
MRVLPATTKISVGAAFGGKLLFLHVLADGVHHPYCRHDLDRLHGLVCNLRIQSRTRKLFFLCASLTVNLGLLFTFKYFDFFSASVRAAFEAMNVTLLAPELKLLLPVGISFYTFQSIAYVVEVYRGRRGRRTPFRPVCSLHLPSSRSLLQDLSSALTTCCHNSTKSTGPSTIPWLVDSI